MVVPGGALFGLPFVDKKYSHALKMLIGLKKHLEYMKLEARRGIRAGSILDGDLPDNIQFFIESCLDKRLKMHRKNKDFRSKLRLSADNDTLEAAPPPIKLKLV